jgi:UDP-glucose 4-epimerase
MPHAGGRFVVTGGAGFVGSHVVDQLLAKGAARVTVVDDLSTGFRPLVPTHDARVQFVEGTLLDQALLDRTFAGHDFVFHLAANADVKDGLLHPRKDVEQNVLATQNVLEAMRANGVKHVAFSSTGSAYGESEVIPTPEDAPMPVQTSLYGASKIAAEGLLTAYAWGYGYRVWIFRFVSLLGVRYSHGHVIDFYKKLRRDPTRLEVLGNGKQRKSYLHVLDCVDAMFTAIQKQSAEQNIGIYNLGHEGSLEVDESIRLICREMNVSPKLEYAGGIRGWVGDSPRIQLDTKRIRALGWAPKRTIEESVLETLRGFATHAFLLRGG